MHKKIRIIMLSIVVLMSLPVIYCILWTPKMTGRTPEANKAVKVAEKNRMPNNDFTYASNMPLRNRIDYTHSSYHPHTCINTATSFYDKHHMYSFQDTSITLMSANGIEKILKFGTLLDCKEKLLF
jgi:hypothetical protein